MKVWFFSPYGGLPSEPWRDCRFVVLGKYLAGKGIHVVWWTAGFSHLTKSVRSSEYVDVVVSDKFVIKLIPTTKYSRNIGIGRIVSNLVFGIRAYRKALGVSPPDCIITGEPPTAFGFAGFRIARRMKIPVIYDQIDLWPELFVKMAPFFLKPLVLSFCLPVFWIRKKSFRGLAGVMGLSEKYLQSALRVNPSLNSRPHAVIYNGIDVVHFQSIYQSLPPHPSIHRKQGEVIAMYSGALGPSYDIRTMIETALRLRREGHAFRLIIAGGGPLRKLVEAEALKHSDTIVYAGVVDSNVLWGIYRLCDIGLAPYLRGSNVEMPDKFYDYTAAGLVVISSLTGEVKATIERNRIGLFYEAGSVDSCHNKVLSLLEDRALLQEMKMNSYKLAADYSSDVQCEKFFKLLEDVYGEVDVDGRAEN